ncbi:hypothetical protein EDB80DRAFT_718576 [Ilyonectria destructans]|nr:hypothetical protein EDB80DRAFT_718576 [Ilyonectria destructans]
MEVVGAVASCIALAQGLEAGLRMVGFFKSIPEIQQDYEALRKEIKSIGQLLRFSQLIADRGPDDDDSPLINDAIQQLKEIEGELTEFATSCSRLTKDQQEKARKRKWILQREKLEKLIKKSNNAKGDLRFAVTCHHAMTMHLTITSIDQITSALIPRSTLSEAGRVEELPDIPVEENQDTASLENIANDKPRSGLEQQSVVSASDSIECSSITFPNASAINQLRESYYTAAGRCPPVCGCKCHFRTTEYKTQPWLRPFLGSLSLSSNTVPRRSRAQCTEPRCKSRDGLALTIEHQFPAWFWAGALAIRASYDVLSGFRYSNSLRPRRVLSLYDGVWSRAVGPADIFYDYLKNSPHYFPDDSQHGGKGILQHAVQYSNYEVIELLLELWKGILAEKSLPRRVGYEAALMLQWNTALNEKEIHLLNRLILLSNDGLQTTETRLHRAVVGRNSIHDVLQDEPWSINMLGSAGYAPIHMATRLDDVATLDKLISSGADVNLRDYRGETPLISAALWDSPKCVQRLLQAKCNLELQDDQGWTAMHYAVACSSANAAMMMLVAGASISAGDPVGGLPVHKLANSQKETQDKLSHLQKAVGFDLDARDEMGWTAMTHAVKTDNLPTLHCLVGAGASLHLVDNHSRNILHYAAGHSKVETLDYLTSLALSGINTEHLDIDGDTPWGSIQYLLDTPRWNLSSWRRPDSNELEAFARLYWDIRNRNLGIDIHIIEEVLQTLSEKDDETSRAKLAPLIRQKEEWKRFDLLQTFRAVDGQIRAGEWKAAEHTLEDVLEDMEEEMELSPWEIKGWWNAESEEDSDDGNEETDEEDAHDEDDPGSDGDPVVSGNETASTHADHSEDEIATSETD